MARSIAAIQVAIWNDPDFLALTVRAQHRYMFLLAQPDTNHLGVIALRPSRWAGLAAGDDEHTVRNSLAELVERRFIVVDESSEELCIRSYLRNDNVFNNPKVLISAKNSLVQVRSERIRKALLAEVMRANDPNVSPATRETLTEMAKQLGRTEPPSDATPDSRGDTPSDTPPRGDAVVDAVGLHAPTPSPATTPAPAAEEVRKQRQDAGMPCGPAWSDDRLQKVVDEALTQTPGATTDDADLVWTTLAQFAADTRIRAETPGLFLHRGLDRLTQRVTARRGDERRKRQREERRIVDADARAAATEPTPEWLARKAAMQGKPAA